MRTGIVQDFVPYIYSVKRLASFETGPPAASKLARCCKSGLNIYGIVGIELSIG